MKIRARLFLLILAVLVLCSSVSFAGFDFSDERFQGVFTTENLDRIIEEYELYDDWYWTTPPYVRQTFHGLQDSPGWTDTAVNRYHRKSYVRGLYGCRWMSNQAFAENSDKYGQGECFGFAQFIGYLLSGEYNPHHNWDYYYNLDASGGLRVGDILRTEFEAGGKKYNHSAVVYSVSDEEILFMQVSGSTYNRIRIGSGFQDGYHNDPDTLEEIAKIPNIKICRSRLNRTAPDPAEDPDPETGASGSGEPDGHE